MKIIFICTGNTCRSPMAEGVFRKLAEEEKLDIKVSSAGLCAKEGEKVSENAKKVCLENGIDISMHTARILKEEDIKEYDVFAAMNETHGYILLKAGVSGDKVFVPSFEIEDPYMGDEDIYRKTFLSIQNMVSELLSAIKERGEIK